MIELRSDNAAGVAPDILAALEAANTGSALAYGGDDLTAHLQDVVRSVFDHPSARAFPVTSGTAANSLALSAATPPWGAVLCHPTAHIVTSEAGATSLFGGGAVMQGVEGDHALIDPDRLRATLDSVRWGDPHESQPSVLSLTLPSDLGTLYRPEEVTALAAIARGSGLKVHLDGARIANAVAALGCSPADVTWRAGVDVLSFGGTKNGAAVGEAVVFFDKHLAAEFDYRCKQAGQLASKMRFLSAPWVGMLTDGAWLKHADHSNAMAARLEAAVRRLPAGLGQRVLFPRQANSVFVELPPPAIETLRDRGWRFYTFIGQGGCRFMCSWDTTPQDVDDFAADLGAALEGTGRDGAAVPAGRDLRVLAADQTV